MLTLTPLLTLLEKAIFHVSIRLVTISPRNSKMFSLKIVKYKLRAFIFFSTSVLAYSQTVLKCCLY